MHFNRYDIVAAYYLFFTNYYDGMGDLKYKRLCKIRTYYKQGLGFGSLSENARAIYHQLVEKENA